MRPFIILISAFLLFNLSSCATHVTRRPVAKVTVVETPPRHYKIVTVKGKRYYFWNGKHYKKTRRGFVVVRV
ncbi:DUF6515 family protein [Seonamhaeicola sp.]|uniref:DUF6515 family protein n=1 Tax=Seonamhaeicola sp. TaxID=1912245 RepID=UPI002604C3D8|nr:DUF6515 family protein [Seonamhaeicola sp.]